MLLDQLLSLTVVNSLLNLRAAGPDAGLLAGALNLIQQKTPPGLGQHLVPDADERHHYRFAPGASVRFSNTRFNKRYELPPHLGNVGSKVSVSAEVQHKAKRDWPINPPAVAFDAQQCIPEPYTPDPIPNPALPAPNKALATVYRYRQNQGVNLGSWFVLEQWMVPSLFTCAAEPKMSELDVAAGWGGQAKQLLEKHWDTFITEEDFKTLAAKGVNLVRLPIGYWHVGQVYTIGTAYESVKEVYEGAWPRILRAVNWAAENGIGVLIDLHGAPGSQNGQTHSGVSDGQTNLFTGPDNMRKAIEVLTFLTQTFVNVPNIVGIQLLNEPVNVPGLLDFYSTALDTLRLVSPEAAKFPFYLHDGFDLQRATDFAVSRKDFLVVDHHSYFVFTPEDRTESASSHTNDISPAGGIGQELLQAGTRLKGNLVMGEWSCALEQSSFINEADPWTARRNFCEEQMKSYAGVGGGWIFWSWTKENCEGDDGWCFRNAIGKALPNQFYSYPGITSEANVPKDIEGVMSVASVASSNATASQSTFIASAASISSDFTASSSSPASDMASSSSSLPTTTASEATLTSTESATSTSAPEVPAESETMVDSEADIAANLNAEASTSATPFYPSPTFFKYGPERRAFMRGSQQAQTFLETLQRRIDEEMGPSHQRAALRSAGLPAGHAIQAKPKGGTTLERRHTAGYQHRMAAIHGRRVAGAPANKRQNMPMMPTPSVSTPSDMMGSSILSADSTILPTSMPTSLVIPHQAAATTMTGAAPLNEDAISQMVAPDGSPLNAAQRAMQTGYSDGYMTAKLFAQHGAGVSRLGFKGQYVEDTIAAHGSKVIEPGKEGYYRDWFDRGLLKGEEVVQKVIAGMGAQNEEV